MAELTEQKKKSIVLVKEGVFKGKTTTFSQLNSGESSKLKAATAETT